MSSAEQTPTLSDEKYEVKSEQAPESDDTVEDDASSLAVKKADLPETMMDVFKKFASTGLNWADMMVEEASQIETAQRKNRMDKIEKEISNFKEPFVILVSYNPTATAEDLYLLFGGKDEAVCDLYLYDEGKSGEALVELKDKHWLTEAFMKHETEFFKEKLIIEYVDQVQQRCFAIPRKVSPLNSRQGQPNYRGPPNRMNNGPARQNQQMRNDRGPMPPQNKPYTGNRPSSRQQQHQSNDVRMQKSYDRPQQIPPLLSSRNTNYRDSNNRDSNNYRDNRYRENKNAPIPMVEPRQKVEPKHILQRPIEQKPSEPKVPKQSETKVPKKSPFGDAKPSEMTNQKLIEIAAKMDAQKDAKKPPIQAPSQAQSQTSSRGSIQKKQSVSSQHSQQLSEDQYFEDHKSNVPITEADLPESTNESEKKGYPPMTILPSSKRRQNPQHPRTDYTSFSRTNQKIDVRGIQKFLPQKSNSKDDRGKHSTKGSEIGSTTSLATNNAGQERRPHHNQRRRYDRNDRKDSNATNAPLEKQLSIDKKSPRPQPVEVSAEPSSTANSSIDTPSVNTPTTTDAPSNLIDNPASASKSKKSKSSKKKKNSTVTSTGMFSALEEVRD